MRKILTIAFLLPLFATAQLHPMKRLIMQEYWIGAIGSDNILYTWGSNIENSSAHPIPGGRTVKDASALFNAFTIVANDGTFWYTDFYNQTGLATMTQVSTDTTGATLNNVIACWGFQSTYFILRADSSLWMGGVDYFNIFTNSSATLRPIKISQTGDKIRSVKLTGGAGSKNGVMAISSDSLTVYNWTGGTGTSRTTTTTTVGTHKFIDANSDGGNQFGYVNYYLIQMTANSAYGHPVASGNNCILMGGSSGCSVNYTLHDLYSDLSLSSVVKEIAVNGFVALIVDSAQNMYELGGYNPQGQLGIGNEAVNKWTYSNSVPNYGWDFITNEYPVYGKQQIGSGVHWSHVSNDGFFIFYNYARDINDSTYAWGRSKQNILAQNYQMQANDYANHPNCCDLLSPTQEHNMWTNVPTYGWTAPTWSAGSNQSISTTSATITASGSPPLITNLSSPFDVRNYTLSTSLWTQISGPNTATITAPGSLSTTVTGLITGTYVFQNLETDNNTGTNLSTVQITVTTSNCNCLQINPGTISKLQQF